MPSAAALTFMAIQHVKLKLHQLDRKAQIKQLLRSLFPCSNISFAALTLLVEGHLALKLISSKHSKGLPSKLACLTYSNSRRLGRLNKD